MSSSKSNYPERPLHGKRPNKPGEAPKKPSSEHISGKRKAWFERATATDAAKGPRITYDKLDNRLSVVGHAPAAMMRFLSKHRGFKVPVKVWGKNQQFVAV